MAGVQDVLTKSLGSSNPHNTVKATFQALTQLQDAQTIAERRGIDVRKVMFG
jgi:small subunit ribosomal protein S5